MVRRSVNNIADVVSLIKVVTTIADISSLLDELGVGYIVPHGCWYLTLKFHTSHCICSGLPHISDAIDPDMVNPSCPAMFQNDEATEFKCFKSFYTPFFLQDCISLYRRLTNKIYYCIQHLHQMRPLEYSSLDICLFYISFSKVTFCCLWSRVPTSIKLSWTTFFLFLPC